MSDEEIEKIKNALETKGLIVFYSFDREDWQIVDKIGSFRSKNEVFDEPGPVMWLKNKTGFVALWNGGLSLDNFLILKRT